jgi:hypothetical protein
VIFARWGEGIGLRRWGGISTPAYTGRNNPDFSPGEMLKRFVSGHGFSRAEHGIQATGFNP